MCGGVCVINRGQDGNAASPFPAKVIIKWQKNDLSTHGNFLRMCPDLHMEYLYLLVLTLAG